MSKPKRLVFPDPDPWQQQSRSPMPWTPPRPPDPDQPTRLEATAQALEQIETQQQIVIVPRALITATLAVLQTRAWGRTTCNICKAPETAATITHTDDCLIPQLEQLLED